MEDGERVEIQATKLVFTWATKHCFWVGNLCCILSIADFIECNLLLALKMKQLFYQPKYGFIREL